jgi:hypothetical protein
VKSNAGLVALLSIAVLTILMVVGLTRPVRVEPGPRPESTVTVPAATDGGGPLDSMLDAIRLGHEMQRGR